MCVGSKYNGISSTSDSVTSTITDIFISFFQASLNIVYTHPFLKMVLVIRPAVIINSNQKKHTHYVTQLFLIF